MNRALVDPIANAVLYEGYILYPYRPSTKNRQRWTFGGLVPEADCRARGGESSTQQTECLVEGSASTTFEAVARFLHLTVRQVGEVDPAEATPFDDDRGPRYRPVDSLRVGGKLFQSWQEAQEREVPFGAVSLGDLCSRPHSVNFTFAGGRTWERLLDATGRTSGILAREQQPLEGSVEASALEVEPGLFRVTFRIANRTPIAEGDCLLPDELQLRSMASTHAILGVASGAFLSLMDPPQHWREAAAACRNLGAWPVLVGSEGQAQMMLSAPIILYDDPQVAPESPGDYFDGTEMDEMLSLRIMTLTDAEKEEMAAVDSRASTLLDRTEALAREELLALHGTIRGLHPAPGEDGHG